MTDIETVELKLKQVKEEEEDLKIRFRKLSDRVMKNFDWREIVGIRHKAKMENVKLPPDSESDDHDDEYAEGANGIKSWAHLMKHLYTSPFIKID